jgi:hypothetical protein
LIESHFGNKNEFKSKLQTPILEEVVDIIFYSRNAFVHCQWDISKLNYSSQESAIRDFIVTNQQANNGLKLDLVDNNILKIKGIEPICRTLIQDSITI